MSNIEWTDRTWNPVSGCTPVSPGCLNCYAATMANRLQANPAVPEYAPRLVDERGNEHRGAVPEERRATLKTVRIAEVRGGRALFTGEVRTLEGRLAEPLSWRKPARVFVNSMSDLFHEAVPFEFVDRVFAVMALCPQHTFQVLTKRPERMTEYLLASRPIGDKRFECETHVGLAAMRAVFEARDANENSTLGKGVTVHRDGELLQWPLPNVWLGTSVEEQARADERVPHLLRCPAAVRFLSCEPLLGAVDLFTHFAAFGMAWSESNVRYERIAKAGIDWVIVGGESGPGSRACDVAWVRSIVGQCRAAGVACFVKQLGARPVNGAFAQNPVRGRIDSPVGAHPTRFADRKGGDPAEWPEDLRVREMPGL